MNARIKPFAIIRRKVMGGVIGQRWWRTRRARTHYLHFWITESIHSRSGTTPFALQAKEFRLQKIYIFWKPRIYTGFLIYESSSILRATDVKTHSQEHKRTLRAVSKDALPTTANHIKCRRRAIVRARQQHDTARTNCGFWRVGCINYTGFYR